MAWEMVELGEVCEIRVGKTPARKNPDYWGKGFSWLSISDMTQQHGRIESTKEEITQCAVDETKISLLPVGTVVISFKLTIGEVGILQKPIYTNEAIAGLIPNCASKIDNRFLALAARSSALQTRTNSAVLGKTLNKKMLSQLTIPLPPLAEQRRIAAILDEAQALTNNYRTRLNEVLAMKQNLAHSVLVSSESTSVPLEDLVEINPRQPRNIPDETETTFVAMSDVDEKLGLTSYASSTFGENKKGYTYFQQGDVLLAKITPCFENGKSGIATIPTKIGHGSTEFHVLRVKDHEHTSAQIIWSLLKSQPFLREGENSMRGSSGHRRVPDWFIRKYPVPVLDKEHTASLTDQLDELDRTMALIHQQIQKAQELYASLSARAFAGEL